MGPRVMTRAGLRGRLRGRHAASRTVANGRRTSNRVTWAPEIEAPLSGPDALQVVFQPLVVCGTDTPRAVTAVARWTAGRADGEPADASGPLWVPATPAALDAALLERAATEVARWRRLPATRALELRVNVSAESLGDPELPARVLATCERTGLEPGALWFEVTEGSVTAGDYSATMLHRLRELGARISVDGFGGRYASLSYIKDLPINGVTLDRGFVADIETDAAGRAIVRTVASIARQLRLTVAADGVQTAGQEAALAELGVDLSQGPYHSDPRPAGERLDQYLAIGPRRDRVFPVVPIPAEEEARLRVVSACTLPLGEIDPILDDASRFLARHGNAETVVVGIADRYWTRYVGRHGTEASVPAPDHGPNPDAAGGPVPQRPLAGRRDALRSPRGGHDAAGRFRGAAPLTRDRGAALGDVLGPGALEVHYQPLVDCRTGELRALEALARWRARDGRLVGAAEVIECLAAADGCAALDLAVLAAAAARIAAWRQLPGLHRLELHVNLSPESLRDLRLAARVARTCDASGLEPTALWLEVTESSVIADAVAAAEALTALRTLGIRITIDDFGVRYASFSYVKQLPINGVKLDRSFVADLETNEASRAIVRAVVSMARQLELSLVAEGVENGHQDEVLKELGVRVAQGYHHGRPLPASAATGEYLTPPPDPRPGSFPAPILADGAERLQIVYACSPPPGRAEPELDELCRFLAEVCDVELVIAGITDRYWTRVLAGHGRFGVGVARTHSPSAHLLTGPVQLHIADLHQDRRFDSHPVVTEHRMRFLAGNALAVAGHRVGAVLIGDPRPRALSAHDSELLRHAAERIQGHLTLRYLAGRITEAESRLTIARRSRNGG